MKVVQKIYMGMYYAPSPGGFCEGNLKKSLISDPRSACGLTVLLFCSVVLALHVFVHEVGVTFDPLPLSCTIYALALCIQNIYN